ncbi:MAG: DinB family protein, partial [Ignavibacteriales bacterium]
LLALEELGEKRLNDYLERKEILSPADMSNKKTYEADFDKKDIRDILLEFRNTRQHLVERLENITKEVAATISVHPRLNQKMRVVDWVYFMSEHDDHHLTTIRLIKNSF